MLLKLFQSTRPRGARRSIAEHFTVRINPFQSTRPRGARPSMSSRLLSKSGFNPRARVGRDHGIASMGPISKVSIHAPAWGATFILALCLKLYTVSIHAPAWGATLSTRLFEGYTHVSIHAPAWGATLLMQCVGSIRKFQSTRPRGARLLICARACHSIGFNPRARVGRDLILSCSRQRLCCFNPRARVGRDNAVLQQYSVSRSFNPALHRKVAVHVSIHAPAWGATLRPSNTALSVFCFNPRARVGRDGAGAGGGSTFKGFNPRARVGRDIFTRDAAELRYCFNPRARVGRDSRLRRPCRVRHVSIHAPAWGAT